MIRIISTLIIFLMVTPVWAVDSYRYLHVTIDTPWSIFIFLLPFILAPFLLMIILYWRYAIKKSRAKKGDTTIISDDSEQPKN